MWNAGRVNISVVSERQARLRTLSLDGYEGKAWDVLTRFILVTGRKEGERAKRRRHVLPVEF